MKQYKTVKFIQLGICIFFDLIFFLILMLTPDLKYSVYTDKALLTLCVIMWIFCLGSLAFLFYDIRKMLEIEIDNHELNKEAYLDNLTGIPNRHSLDVVFSTYTEEKNLAEMGCGVIRLANLAEVNNKFGHEVGDKLIQDFSNMFETVGDRYGFVGRNGGNEYLALFENCTAEKMESFFQDLEDCLKMYNRNQDNNPVKITYAYVLNSEIKAVTMTDLIGMAYRRFHDEASR